mgnify:CR=1 FL=1
MVSEPGGVWARAAAGMLWAIVGLAVVGGTDTVGVEVDVVAEEVEGVGSGLAPPPHPASSNEAASKATEVFFTVPPTLMSQPLAAMVSSADHNNARTPLDNYPRTPHTRRQGVLCPIRGLRASCPHPVGKPGYKSGNVDNMDEQVGRLKRQMKPTRRRHGRSSKSLDSRPMAA